MAQIISHYACPRCRFRWSDEGTRTELICPRPACTQENIVPWAWDELEVENADD